MSKRALDRIPGFVPGSENIHAVIEVPRGSRNKFSYKAEHRCFKLTSILPSGLVYPFDYGFIPSTLGDDGDPLDVFVLSDEPLFSGCVVEARLVGVLEANEIEGGETKRNDRFVAAACCSSQFAHVASLKDIDERVLNELGKFCATCHQSDGKTLKLLGSQGPKSARDLVHEGMKQRTRSEKKS